MIVKPLLQRIIPALALLSLTACLSLIKDPDPITTYSLRHPFAPEQTAGQVGWALTVIRPNSSALLDSNRLAVRPQPNVLQVYKGANWSEAMPDMVQTHIVEAFENSGRIKTVSRQNSGVPADVALLIDIRRFESVYADGAKIPDAVISLHAKLLEYPSNRVIAVQNFSAQVPAASKEVPAVVQAIEQGLNQTTSEMVSWALANGHPKTKK